MAATGKLTDKAIQAALKSAATAGKARALGDGGGLMLEAQPSGSGWWRLRYSFGGRENRLSLGTYPEVSLKDARQRRDEARKLVAAGTDPSDARKADKAAATASAEAKRLAAAGKPGPGTFECVAREWLETVHQVKVSEGHSDRTRIRFEQDVFPWLGARPIASIDAPELLTCLRRVTARGAIETAHRIKDACSQVFRFGVASGYCERNPAADLRDALPPVPTRHLAAIVEPKRAAELLRAMMDYKGHPVTRAALALSALVFLRPGELRQLEWAWVDQEQAVIVVPSTLMKRRKAEKVNGAPHIVPLARQAQAILRELHALTGHGRYLFPSLLTGERPMSDNTVRVSLRRMGYTNDDMTAHGFRAMARTMAAERLGVAPEVIEAQLAHEVADSLGRAYNRTQYLEQRRELMQKWADYLDRLRAGAQVIEMPSKRA
ncbi:tyrosine-type recombinase/integrase [Piscinibacter defluvii]|uniref:tyrosine-type recombinase/integrase n=1 Tax=Piscinibacter defluvii TaxID=1796922 RepID=UPI000FDE4DE3|nr:integrase arm-type DNA-binding domain-containing protein [Piscinibacter defluvii]